MVRLRGFQVDSGLEVEVEVSPGGKVLLGVLVVVALLLILPQAVKSCREALL